LKFDLPKTRQECLQLDHDVRLFAAPNSLAGFAYCVYHITLLTEAVTPLKRRLISVSMRGTTIQKSYEISSSHDGGRSWSASTRLLGTVSPSAGEEF
jgi:hypothetical protein